MEIEKNVTQLESGNREKIKMEDFMQQ